MARTTRRVAEKHEETLLEIVMKSPSSTSVHNRQNEKAVLDRQVLLRVLLSLVGVLVLTLSIIVTTASPAGPSRRHGGAEFNLVDSMPESGSGIDSKDDHASTLEEHRENLEALQAEVDALSEELAGLQAELNTRSEELDELEAELGIAEEPPAASSEEEGDDPAADPPMEGPATEGTETEGPEAEGPESEDSAFFYENCDEARADGAAPVQEGDPGFGPHLDADDDGIGCE
jgi:hypothetical protein